MSVSRFVNKTVPLLSNAGTALLRSLPGMSTSYFSTATTVFTPTVAFPLFRNFSSTASTSSTTSSFQPKEQFSLASKEMNAHLKAHMNDLTATTDHNIGAGFARLWINMFYAGREKDFFTQVLAICETPSLNIAFAELLKKIKQHEALTTSEIQTEELLNFLVRIHTVQVRTELEEDNSNLTPHSKFSLHAELDQLVAAHQLNTKVPLAFCITDTAHEIGLRYIDENKKWLLVDVNGLKVLPHTEIASNIVATLANSNDVIVNMKFHFTSAKKLTAEKNAFAEEKEAPACKK